MKKTNWKYFALAAMFSSTLRTMGSASMTVNMAEIRSRLMPDISTST